MSLKRIQRTLPCSRVTTRPTQQQQRATARGRRQRAGNAAGRPLHTAPTSYVSGYRSGTAATQPRRVLDLARMRGRRAGHPNPGVWRRAPPGTGVRACAIARVGPPANVRCSGDTRPCAAIQKSARFRFPHTSSSSVAALEACGGVHVCPPTIKRRENTNTGLQKYHQPPPLRRDPSRLRAAIAVRKHLNWKKPSGIANHNLQERRGAVSLSTKLLLFHLRLKRTTQPNGNNTERASPHCIVWGRKGKKKKTKTRLLLQPNQSPNWISYTKGKEKYIQTAPNTNLSCYYPYPFLLFSSQMSLSLWSSRYCTASPTSSCLQTCLLCYTQTHAHHFISKTLSCDRVQHIKHPTDDQKTCARLVRVNGSTGRCFSSADPTDRR
jgi:hypothetical protein